MQDLYTIEDNSIEVTETVVPTGAAPNHSALLNRDAPSQHPISAIEGLRAELDKIEELKTVVSNSKGFAQYHMWSDQNPNKDITRIGRFVSLTQDGGIQICSDDDASILGVVVDETNLANPIGFVGGKPTSDEAVWNSIKHRYGLVAILGNALVRIEENVRVGDYVLPNSEGIAAKSTIGYRVTALSNIESVPYASINLVSDGQALHRLREQIDSLNAGVLERLEVATITQAEDLMDLVNNSINQSFDITIAEEITIDGVAIPRGSGHLIVSAVDTTMYLVEGNGSISVFYYTGTWQRGGTSIPIITGNIQEYALSLPEYMVTYFATNDVTSGLPDGASQHCTGTIFRRGAADTDQSWIELNDGSSNVQYRCYYDIEAGSWSEWQGSDHVACADTAANLALFAPHTTQEFMEFLHNVNNENKTFSFATNSAGEGIALINNYGTENEETVCTIPAYARGTLTRTKDSALNLVDCDGKHFIAYYSPPLKTWAYKYDEADKANKIKTIIIRSYDDLMSYIPLFPNGNYNSYAVAINDYSITFPDGTVLPEWGTGMLVVEADASLTLTYPDGSIISAFCNNNAGNWSVQKLKQKPDEASRADIVVADVDTNYSYKYIYKTGVYVVDLYCDISKGGVDTFSTTVTIFIDDLSDSKKVCFKYMDVNNQKYEEVLYYQGGMRSEDGKTYGQLYVEGSSGEDCVLKVARIADVVSDIAAG